MDIVLRSILRRQIPFLIGGVITGTIMTYYYGLPFTIVVNSAIWYGISYIVSKYYWKNKGLDDQKYLIQYALSKIHSKKRNWLAFHRHRDMIKTWNMGLAVLREPRTRICMSGWIIPAYRWLKIVRTRLLPIRTHVNWRLPPFQSTNIPYFIGIIILAVSFLFSLSAIAIRMYNFVPNPQFLVDNYLTRSVQSFFIF